MPNLEVFESTDTDEKLITDLVKQMLNLGDYIGHQVQLLYCLHYQTGFIYHCISFKFIMIFIMHYCIYYALLHILCTLFINYLYVLYLFVIYLILLTDYQNQL